MEQPFAHTLSFDDLEVLVLVEDGGASPREVADSLGMDLEETMKRSAPRPSRRLSLGRGSKTISETGKPPC
jgi:hypothetical protein